MAGHHPWSQLRDKLEQRLGAKGTTIAEVAAVPVFRVWVTVRGLPVLDEARWMPLIEHLDSEAKQYGPVIGWHDGEAEIVLAVDAENPADASVIACQVIASALDTVGLGALYPSALRIDDATMELSAGRRGR